MRILAIRDFHGKFPKKFKKIIKKEKIDVVIDIGDHNPFKYRKLWFKHCYKKDIELWEAIGKEKTKQLIIKDNKLGEKVIKQINKLPAPVFLVYGNIDGKYETDTHDPKPRKKIWKWYNQDFFTPMLKKYKNIKEFTYLYIRFKNYIFIGAYGQTFPGRVKSKNYRKSKAKLDRLFKKFQKENKQDRVIFVSHNTPYNTKLDKLSMTAHEKVRGKHYGSKLIKRTIQKYQPILAIAGHHHECFGKDKIGKTIALNVGSAAEGEGIIIELKDNKKPKIKFINPSISK